MNRHEAQEQKLALFNAAMGVIIRLNAILNKCLLASNTLDMNRWYNLLKSFYREIDCKMKDEQITEIDKLFKDLHNKVQSYHKQSLRKPDTKVKSDVYDSLDVCEKKLRRIAEQYGLLNPNQKTIHDAMSMI